MQSGAYLERKFRFKIYCIAWKATNLKIPKMERSVFLGFKNFKNRTVLLKTERLASLNTCIQSTLPKSNLLGLKK